MTYDNVAPQAAWVQYRVGQGILIENGRVLLSGNRWYSGKPLVWTLPGGRAEDGEGVAEACKREFMEETGLQIEVGELAYVVEARSEASRRLFLTCVFVVSHTSNDTPTTGDDPGVEELRYVPLGETGEYMPSASMGAPFQWYLQHPGEPMRYWFFPEYIS